MQTDHRLFLEKFVLNVQALRDTHTNAKKATQAGQHSKARDLHNESQKIGQSIDGMIPTANSIIKGSEQIILL